MRENFQACLRTTLAFEGGYSDHPRDPGGATMKGITLAVYRQSRPGATKSDLRAITDAEVERIYREGYWNPVHGDDLPAGIDQVVFDLAVNSGVSRSSKFLQRALGATEDGKIGPRTMELVRSANRKEVIQRLCDQRLFFLQSLDTWDTFGKGWSRRVLSVLGVAAFMAA